MQSPESSLKRRNPSTSPDPDNKRRRLSPQHDESRDKDEATANPDSSDPKPDARSDKREPSPSSQQTADRRSSRQTARGGNGRDEERKRGQRLFGALLGTLSQKPSTAAQRRRADIERKQQAKLKMQDEEYDEIKRKRREDVIALRKKEQKYLEMESVGYHIILLRLWDSGCWTYC